jgi:hypothetical protein
MLLENSAREVFSLIKKLSIGFFFIGISIAAPAAQFLGPGSGAGKLGSPADMNRICRETFAEEENQHGNVRWASTADYLEARICRETFAEEENQHGNVRWASTADYLEASNRQGWGGETGHEFGLDRVALRAENTIFTPNGRSYDKATGAMSPPDDPRFPGAVVITKDAAWFARRGTVVIPMCVYGSPSHVEDR